MQLSADVSCPPVELEVSLVVETYTHGEGSALRRTATALSAAAEMVELHGAGELLVADSSGDPELAELLAARFPQARRIDALGLGYDEAKTKAAAEARGGFVLFLDGDCIPEPGWLEQHLDALRADAAATGGFTRYDGGFLGALDSVLDFGFLLPVEPRALGCYAFNNSGFRRDVLRATPIPGGPMRCHCYAHAQLLRRVGTPVQLVPGARARHERQPFLRERFRQGFDLVASCWTDPALPEARLLRLGVVAAPLFYARAILHDWRRLRVGRRDLDLAPWQAAAGAVLLPLFRLVDLAGILRALAPGGRESRVGLSSVAT
jgi:Glycosyl transferase family 2